MEIVIVTLRCISKELSEWLIQIILFMCVYVPFVFLEATLTNQIRDARSLR